MPKKPLKPCLYPRCPNLSDQSYCELHRKAVKAERNRDYDINRRDKELQRFYNSAAWRELRRHKLARNPMCEICYADGRIEIATIVDHIVPVKDDYCKRLDMENMQSVCIFCHSRKTRREEAERKLTLDDPDYKF